MNKDIEVKILNEEYHIDKSQEEKLIELIKNIRRKETKELLFITESIDQLPLFVQIIIGGVVWDLSKQTYRNYKGMIKDIINKE